MLNEKKNVLIVDDQEDCRIFVKTVLSETGISIPWKPVTVMTP